MADESQEVKLAVAVNDITWMKSTLTDVSEGMKNLQTAFEQNAQVQGKTYATKEDLKAVSDEVDKLKTWRNFVGGAMALCGFLAGLGIEAWRTWKG